MHTNNAQSLHQGFLCFFFKKKHAVKQVKFFRTTCEVVNQDHPTELSPKKVTHTQERAIPFIGPLKFLKQIASFHG